MNANIMKYDLQGHQRLHKVILKFQRGSLAHCPSPSLTFSLCLSIFSLSRSSSLFLFFHPPLPSNPLNRHNNHPTAAAEKKIQWGTLAHHLSPPLSFSYSLSMPLYLFSLSLVLLLSFFFSTHSPPPTTASYPPYVSLSFLSPLFFFSFFLTLTYVLMDNFLSLFLSI